MFGIGKEPEDDIAFSQTEINELASKTYSEDYQYHPSKYLFYIFEINDDEIKFLITSGIDVNLFPSFMKKDDIIDGVLNDIERAHKVVYGENCRKISHFLICTQTKNLIESVYGSLVSKYIVSKNNILDSFNNKDINHSPFISEAIDDDMVNVDDDDDTETESVQSSSFDVDPVDHFLVNILSKFIENTETNFKFISDYIPKEKNVKQTCNEKGAFTHKKSHTELMKNSSYYGNHELVIPTEKPFFGEIGFDYFSFGEMNKGTEFSSLGCSLYRSDKEEEEIAKEKENKNDKLKIKSCFQSMDEIIDAFHVYYNKINKNIFTISSSLVKDINFKIYFPEFEYQTTLSEEKKNILDTFLPSYKDVEEEDVIRAINSINQNINYSEKHIIQLIKKVIQLNYKIIGKPLSTTNTSTTGRIKHKIKSSILFQQVSKLCFIRLKEHEKILRLHLSDILSELGLEKKRYNDGFYWYRIKPRFKSTFLKALNSGAYRTFYLNNNLINYYRKVYIINGQLYQEELDNILKEMNAVPTLELHRPKLIDELKTYEMKKRECIQSFFKEEEKKNLPSPWLQSSRLFETKIENGDAIQSDLTKLRSSRDQQDTQHTQSKIKIDTNQPGKFTSFQYPTYICPDKEDIKSKELLDKAVDECDTHKNEETWNISTRDKVTLDKIDGYHNDDDIFNAKLKKLQHERQETIDKMFPQTAGKPHWNDN